MNKQRKTSHILNVFQYDEVTGAVTLPSTLVLTAPDGSDNSTKVPTTAWTRGYVSGLSYLTGNQSITVSGDATGSGTTSINLTLANTAVTPGTYGSTTLVPVVTVDSKGRITNVTTAAISGSLSFTGDVTGTGTTGTSTGLTLANSGVTAGTYTKVTVDSKGRVTVGASATTSDISEGTNLYYTDARVLAYLGANNYATQSYVGTQIANLVASAPATLDTLNELAAALGNDASFATTTATSLGNRLRVDTAAQGLNTTQQSNGRTNLGLGTAATSAIGDFATAAQGTKADSAFGWSNHASAGYLTSATAATTYASLTGSYANPSWITSLAYSKITGVPAFLTSYTETDPFRVTTVSVTGTSTKTITLTRADNSTVSTTWTDIDTDTNTFASSLGFSGGTLTLTNNNSSTVTVSLDGRYYLASNPNSYITSSSNISGSSASAPILTASGSLTTQYGNGTIGYSYALTNPQTGLFSAVDNSNAIITINRHPDNYYSQLGFSSNGNLYYRSFSAAAINTSQGWQTIWTSNSLTNLNQLSNGPGYITGITSSMVTTALGYTPYNSTNPNGYITSSALSSYLPLSGGTMSGTLTLSSISGTDQTVENTFGAYLHLGAWGVARTATNAVLVNTAYRADYATDLFDMNISRFTNNSGYITSSGSISGNAATVTINYNDNSNASYQLLWGSGNNVYGTGDVWVNPNSDIINARGGFISTSNPWGTSNSAFFPNGITTAGGTNWIYGSTTYIGNAPANGAGHEFYSSGSSYSTGNIETIGSMRAPIFYDRNDTTYYGDFASTSRIRSLNMGYVGGQVYLNSDGGTLFFNANGESDIQGYSIGTTMENYGGNYTKLTIDWHTGIKIGAASGYGGIRFYNNSVKYYSGSQVFSVAEGDNNVRVSNTLFVNGDVRSPIYYDSNDTAYYLNPAGGSRLRNLYVGDSGDDWSDPGGWGTQVRFSNGPHVRFVLHARSPGIEAGMYVHTPGSVFIGSFTSHDVSMMYAGNRKMQITNSYIYTDVYLEAAGSLRAPIFYDSNDTAYYLDPNSESSLYRFTSTTMTRNAMNYLSINSPFTTRAAQAGPYQNGTMGWGTVDFNTVFSNWGSGFIDTWSNPGNAPGGSSHYVGIQSCHYNHQNSANVYGFQMACAGEADNRFFWRSAWPSMRGWVEMIHTGNIGSQSVNYASTAGSANSVAWSNVSGRPTTVSSFTNDSGYITSGSNVVGVYSSGFGNGNFTWYQSPSNFQQWSGGWASHLVSNHGDGATYYHQTIIMPFWGVPQYMRKEGGTNRGPWTFWTEENYNPSNHSGNYTANGFIRVNANNNLYLDYNHGQSIVGVYSSYRFQGVYSMGDAYKLAIDGTTPGNLYGLSWSHPNAGGQASRLNDHGLMVMINGITQSAFSSNIWAAGDITAYSDIRVKDNIKTIDNALEKVQSIRGVTFTRNDMTDTTTRHAGVIAQEVLEVLPEVVTKDGNDHYSVAYGNLNALLIEAIKEQQKQIEELQKKLDSLIQN